MDVSAHRRFEEKETGLEDRVFTLEQEVKAKKEKSKRKKLCRV